METCRVAIDCPQGRIQNVNTHLRWGGTGGEGLNERMMAQTWGVAGWGAEVLVRLVVGGADRNKSEWSDGEAERRSTVGGRMDVGKVLE